MKIKDFPAKASRIEWPTVALVAVIYAMWLGATFFWDRLPLWTLTLIGAWTTAWHMSLQREIIHGHPTRKRWINNLIGQWPLALWLPFENYRRSHLAHHLDERLTDPLDDPESYYWRQEDWDRLGSVGRGIVRLQSCLLGRLLIGPFWAAGRLWKGEVVAIARGARKTIRQDAVHVVLGAIVLAWVLGICRMPLLTYLFCFAYAGTSLALVRSFAEHRADSLVERRTAIVERSWVLGFLFLFNNLHLAHHMRHAMPWYALPRWYRMNRAALIERTPFSPGLPFIMSAALAKTRLDAVRAALFETLDDPALAGARDALGLAGAVVLGDDDYRRVTRIEQRAIAAGYPTLA